MEHYLRSVFFIFVLLAVPQFAFALGQNANVITCKPSPLGGEVHIEKMIYDHSRGRKRDDLLQYGNKNYFYVEPQLQRKLSEALIEGEIMSLEPSRHSKFLKEASILYAYTDENSFNNADNILANKPRERTETWAGENPGSLTLNASHSRVTCEFTSHKNIYTKISVSINTQHYTRYDIRSGDFEHYEEGSQAAEICGGIGMNVFYKVDWFTASNEAPIQSKKILAYCSAHRSRPYDVSLAKIHATGRVDVELTRGKTLHKDKTELVNRQIYNLTRD